MTYRPLLTARGAVLAVALALAAGACGSSSATSSTTTTPSATTSAKATASGPLVGLFKLDPGACGATGYTSGSYFKMVMPGGDLEQGKFFADPDSTCADKNFILITPGSDGGLSTVDYQPRPAPPFDGSGNALASRIIQPELFTGIKFSVSSNPVEPQTNASVPKPSITVNDGKLTGNVQALTGEWNKQAFSQGSPKPDGSLPGLTRAVTGTYDASTGHYSLTWSSQISGGPFNDFTGLWHLEGTFVRRGTAGA